jgi:hypothetical protein
MHPLPNQYKGKAYTAVIITFVCNEGDANCHYAAYTANHHGICGIGETRPKAIDNLRENILECINNDIENQLPVEFCVDLIPQLTDRFIESLIEQLNAADRLHILQVDVIELTPF